MIPTVLVLPDKQRFHLDQEVDVGQLMTSSIVIDDVWYNVNHLHHELVDGHLIRVIHLRLES